LHKAKVVRHRFDIDGLRGIAVLSVIFYHFNITWFSGGFVGVDIFFVISGFVIAGSILDDLRAGKFSIATFYFRRIRRIVPAFAALVVVTSIAASAILLSPDLVDYSRSVISANLFASNIYFWKSSGYFAAEAHTKPLLHTWSLAVEEQFYFFAPVLFLLVYRFGRKHWPWFMVPLLVLSLALSIAAVFVGPTAGFFLLPTRAWELLLGAAIAFGRRPVLRPWLWEIAAGFGLLLILFGVFFLDTTDPFPGWNALFPCVGTALVILAAVGLKNDQGMPWANRVLAAQPLVWVGLISYSLYLIHWPISAFTQYRLLREPTLTEAALMTVASIVLAWLSWRYVEQPFRQLREQKRSAVLCGGVAVFGIGIAIGALGVLLKGLPQRFPDFVERQIPGVEDWGGDQCFNQDSTHPTPWTADACTRIRGSKGRILVWGDSFAAQYMPGILRNAHLIDANVLQYTFAGCPPILAYFSYARVGCSVFNRKVPSIVQDLKIDTVVLAARWTATPFRNIDELPETVAQLKAIAARVYVIGQSPEFEADVQHIDYISGNYKHNGPAYSTIAFDPTLNERIAERARQAHFIDPLLYLCNGRVCEYRSDDDFYYADYGHFSTSGSVRAVRSYFPTFGTPKTSDNVMTSAKSR
jgi:peptidoglycan/LPS O-acetylase OafA/YrhL